MSDNQRDDILEEIATLCEEAELMFDIQDMLHATKKEMTAITARKLAELIRSKKSK